MQIATHMLFSVLLEILGGFHLPIIQIVVLGLDTIYETELDNTMIVMPLKLEL